jgi:hypothetical protein
MAPVHVQWATPHGCDATTRYAGITTKEFLQMHIAACMASIGGLALASDARNLALLPLLIEFLKAPESLPEFVLPGVLYATTHGFFSCPAAATKMVAEGIIPVLMSVLRRSSPRELILADGFLRRPYGLVLFTMSELVYSAQQAGMDLTEQLLAAGYIDIVIAALGAVEDVGDDVGGTVVVWGLLLFFERLEGKALAQIEDKLRPKISSLRHLLAHDIGYISDWGWNSRGRVCH